MSYLHRFGLAILLSFVVPSGLLAAAHPTGAEISVRVAKAGSVANPLVGVFPDGGFVVAWVTGSPTSVIHARIFAASGSPTSGEFRLVQPFNQLLDDLAVTADGGFVLVWEQPRPKNRNITSVLARRFDRQGNPETAAFVVHDPSSLSVFGAKVAATADGGFAIAWTADVPDPSNPNSFIGIRSDTFVRSFAAGGSAKGAARLVAKGYVGDDSFLVPAAMAAAPDGTLVLASDCYCDQPGMTIHRILPAGEIESIDAVTSNFDDLQLSPSLAMAADGSFVVAWQTAPGQLGPVLLPPSAIKARRFAADGSPLGDVFQVNRRGGYEIAPHLAALSGGGFLAIWADEAGRDGGGFGIFARSYAADGSTTGPDAVVNQGTAGDQLATSLAAGAQGVAVWPALGPGATGSPFAYSRIQARRLIPN